ncbi:hypothetical protein sscle_12g090800 [Sclerotinia sclerotiorum 1980 UF-70]|uniref:Uncharacterized protein n=1 Tax=Sclerotinia sclerotiorum (strain ATCC 18683 / 1980 / Ss-1) TaxID=665079 RepID=A0A1D9QH80_SCLS1|nr:hypothetical protein sscle_12g090800 [Sclerotinia sclerotiorum 1980 UF-70]
MYPNLGSSQLPDYNSSLEACTGRFQGHRLLDLYNTLSSKYGCLCNFGQSWMGPEYTRLVFAHVPYFHKTTKVDVVELELHNKGSTDEMKLDRVHFLSISGVDFPFQCIWNTFGTKLPRNSDSALEATSTKVTLFESYSNPADIAP